MPEFTVEVLTVARFQVPVDAPTIEAALTIARDRARSAVVLAGGEPGFTVAGNLEHLDPRDGQGGHRG